MPPPTLIAGLSRVLLCLTLPRVASWSAPLARVQGSARRIGPRMSGDRGDSLSSEFERLAAARSGTVFGRAPDLLREHKMRGSWVLIFNAGQDDEGLYTLQGSEASELDLGVPENAAIFVHERDAALERRSDRVSEAVQLYAAVAEVRSLELGPDQTR